MDTTAGVAQLDALIAEFRVYGTLPDRDLEWPNTRLRAAIDRLSPPDSTYRREADRFNVYEPRQRQDALIAIVMGLRDDMKAGYTQTFTEMVHADTYDNLLDQADGLLKERYKDAAAVIGGAALETHLRYLCEKHQIPTRKGNGDPKTGTPLNDDLKAKGVYVELQRSAVDALLKIRNASAHGRTTEYDLSQVTGMLRDVRAFMLRFPA